jgi:hypothetical protein
MKDQYTVQEHQGTLQYEGQGDGTDTGAGSHAYRESGNQRSASVSVGLEDRKCG